MKCLAASFHLHRLSKIHNNFWLKFYSYYSNKFPSLWHHLRHDYFKGPKRVCKPKFMCLNCVTVASTTTYCQLGLVPWPINHEDRGSENIDHKSFFHKIQDDQLHDLRKMQERNEWDQIESRLAHHESRIIVILVTSIFLKHTVLEARVRLACSIQAIFPITSYLQNDGHTWSNTME